MLADLFASNVVHYSVVEATRSALDTINAITNREAITDFSSDAVEAIAEDRIHEIILHTVSHFTIYYKRR